MAGYCGPKESFQSIHSRVGDGLRIGCLIVRFFYHPVPPDFLTPFLCALTPSQQSHCILLVLSALILYSASSSWLRRLYTASSSEAPPQTLRNILNLYTSPEASSKFFLYSIYHLILTVYICSLRGIFESIFSKTSHFSTPQPPKAPCHCQFLPRRTISGS